jgi:hypothetical protein
MLCLKTGAKVRLFIGFLGIKQEPKTRINKDLINITQRVETFMLFI